MSSVQTEQGRAMRAEVSSEQVWRSIERSSFAVLSHVTPSGRPRSSGVMFVADDGHLFVVVDRRSWKARQIQDGAEVALVVTVRRGGLLSLMAPIPPATISFHARAIVHPAGELAAAPVPERLAKVLPESRRADVCVLELVPEGHFLTYGIGVPLMQMRDPERAGGRVPVSA